MTPDEWIAAEEAEEWQAKLSAAEHAIRRSRSLQERPGHPLACWDCGKFEDASVRLLGATRAIPEGRMWIRLCTRCCLALRPDDAGAPLANCTPREVEAEVSRMVAQAQTPPRGTPALPAEGKRRRHASPTGHAAGPQPRRSPPPGPSTAEIPRASEVARQTVGAKILASVAFLRSRRRQNAT